jgi:hypothetical protein
MARGMTFVNYNSEMWKCRRNGKWISPHSSWKLEAELLLKEIEGNLVHLFCLFSVNRLAGTAFKFRIRVLNLYIWMQQILQQLENWNQCSMTLENTIRSTLF